MWWLSWIFQTQHSTVSSKHYNQKHQNNNASTRNPNQKIHYNDFVLLGFISVEIWNIRVKKAANVLLMYHDEINVKPAVLPNVLRQICDQKVNDTLIHQNSFSRWCFDAKVCWMKNVWTYFFHVCTLLLTIFDVHGMIHFRNQKFNICVSLKSVWKVEAWRMFYWYINQSIAHNETNISVKFFVCPFFSSVVIIPNWLYFVNIDCVTLQLLHSIAFPYLQPIQ